MKRTANTSFMPLKNLFPKQLCLQRLTHHPGPTLPGYVARGEVSEQEFGSRPGAHVTALAALYLRFH
jgi:hypothetical protein